MHIIFNDRQRHKMIGQRKISLFILAAVVQMFAHGLHAQLLAEKIPLGK